VAEGNAWAARSIRKINLNPDKRRVRVRENLDCMVRWDSGSIPRRLYGGTKTGDLANIRIVEEKLENRWGGKELGFVGAEEGARKTKRERKNGHRWISNGQKRGLANRGGEGNAQTQGLLKLGVMGKRSESAERKTWTALSLQKPEGKTKDGRGGTAVNWGIDWTKCAICWKEKDRRK